MCLPRCASCMSAFVAPVTLSRTSRRRPVLLSRPPALPVVRISSKRCLVRMHGSVWDGGHSHSHSKAETGSHSHDHSHSHSHDEHACGEGHSHRDGHDASHPHSSSQTLVGFSACGGHDHGNLPRPIAALIDLRERPAVAAASSVLLVLAAVLPGLPSRAAVYLCLALSGLPALAESGARVVESRGREVNVDALMTLAAGAAVASGAALEGALLTTLYAASHAVEHIVTAKARRDLDALRDLAPSLALRYAPTAGFTTTPESVPVSELVVGDRVLVRAGEVVPCDGIVVDGSAFIAAQHLTGEAKPRPVAENESVPAGARPLDASVVVKVTAIGAESAMARISRLVVSAQANRPRVTRFFDKYTRIYTRIVLALAAALVFVLPIFRVPIFGENGSLKRSLGFLVAASPCALIIGAPVAYLASLSAAARRGVLVKNGPRALDATANAKHIVFDKTGTLTTGNLRLVEVLAFPPRTSWPVGSVPKGSLLSPVGADTTKFSSVLKVAAELERGAVHPVAEAIIAKADALCGKENLTGEGAFMRSSLKTIPGQGVEAQAYATSNATARLEREACRCGAKRDVTCVCEEPKGSARIRLGRMSFVLPGLAGVEELFDTVSDGGGFVVSALATGDEHFLLLFRDEVRSEASDGVSLLRKQGLAVSLLTGDSDRTAQLVSGEIGVFDNVIANATPESKLDRIRFLHNAASSESSVSKESGHGEDHGPVNGGVVMVGDGVNDAPALAAATVGIACGLSSATAVQAADVVLVRKDLRDVAWYVRKANATQTIVKQNLVIALGLMLVAVCPILAGTVPLWLAVTLHEGGTILVGLNGLRLLSDRLS